MGTVALGTLAVVGTGLAAVGQIQAAQAAAAQAESAKAMAEYNAQVAEQEAKAIERRTGFEGRRAAEAAERRQSKLRAALGTAGVILTAGAPLKIQAEEAKESELEQLLISYEGDVAASRARSQAVLDRAQADIFGQRAGAARTAGFIGAGSTLLTGFGQLGSTFRTRSGIRSTIRGVDFTRKTF